MTSIDVTFLGTAATIPTKSRNHPALYIKYKGKEESCVLFDCGEGTQRQIFRAGLNFMRIDNIFITHWHADHFAGLLGLITTMNLEGRKRPLNIFAPEADNFVDSIVNMGYWAKTFPVIAKNVEFEGSSPQKLLDEAEFEVLAIPAKHGIPAVAYAIKEKDRARIDSKKASELGLPKQGRIFGMLKEKGTAVYKGKTIRLDEIAYYDKGKKVVYSGDTMPCRNIITLAKDADILIHDSTFFEDSEKMHKHANVEEVFNIAAEANVKKLVLTHISRRYADIRELQDKIKGHKNVVLANDFMTVSAKD